MIEAGKVRQWFLQTLYDVSVLIWPHSSTWLRCSLSAAVTFLGAIGLGELLLDAFVSGKVLSDGV